MSGEMVQYFETFIETEIYCCTPWFPFIATNVIFLQLEEPSIIGRTVSPKQQCAFLRVYTVRYISICPPQRKPGTIKHHGRLFSLHMYFQFQIKPYCLEGTVGKESDKLQRKSVRTKKRSSFESRNLEEHCTPFGKGNISGSWYVLGQLTSRNLFSQVANFHASH